MTTFIVPPLEEQNWPTLGPGVCDWMESGLAFGPGDLLGQPLVLDDEDRAIIGCLYSVYPKDHERAGRRVYDLGVVMTRKGSKKTERAAAIAAAELSDEAPVRFDGWRRQGRAWIPVGRPVTDPYIPMVAFSEKQAEDTTFSALYAMLSHGPSADRFDIGLSRIMRIAGDGKAEALANAPDSRDGARTTFQVKEETHRWTLPRQLEASRTMSANLAKRPLAEPWELHVTTMYTPGEGSLAEEVHDAAKVIAKSGRPSRMWLLYRYADEKIDIGTETGLHRALVDASGPSVAVWSDIPRIASQWSMPGADVAYLNRVWLNRAQLRHERAFDADRWKVLADPDHVVPPKALIAAGFKGLRGAGAVALVATELATGFQWPAGIWDATTIDDEELRDAIDVAVDGLFAGFKVARLYANPTYWKDELVAWRGRYGDKVVVPWETWRNRAMGFAFRNYAAAIGSGKRAAGADVALTHSGDAAFTAQIGHCFKRLVTERDDKGERLWVVRKEKPDSPLEVEDAIAAGALETPKVAVPNFFSIGEPDEAVRTQRVRDPWADDF